MTICVFTGGVNSFNVCLDVANLGKMLSEQSDLHLVTNTPNAFTDASEFEKFSGDGSTLYHDIKLLQSYLRAHDPSVLVQMTEPPIHGNIVGLLAKKHNIPAVYRYAGDRFRSHRLYNGWKYVGLYGLNNVVGRLPMYLSDRYITLGPHGRGRIVAHGAPPERVHVLPPPVNPARFTSEDQAELHLPDERQIILLLGKVSRLKGVETIERTIGHILERRPDLQFVFVGPVKNRLTVAPEYEDHLSYVGSVPPETVPAYLRSADLLVHPSLTEGLPRVLLESLFAETPVLARDVGDVESVTDNTFRNDRQFVEMLCSFEELPLDDPTPYSVDALQSDYQEFFDNYIN